MKWMADAERTFETEGRVQAVSAAAEAACTLNMGALFPSATGVVHEHRVRLVAAHMLLGHQAEGGDDDEVTHR